MTTAEDVNRALADAHRHEWAKVLAATVRVAGELDLALECTQDAYLNMLETWRRDGIPRKPRCSADHRGSVQSLDAQGGHLVRDVAAPEDVPRGQTWAG